MEEPFKITTGTCWARFSLAAFALELSPKDTQRTDEQQQKSQKEADQNGTR